MWFEMTMCVAVAMFSPLAVSPNSNFRTLRTLQRQVCDEEELQIECWPNTVISISQAEYGAPVATSDVQCLDMKNAARPKDTAACAAQDVREGIHSSCKDKQKCHLRISSKLLKEDNCPGVQRYLDVSFKCRPSKFFTKVACEGSQAKIRCRKGLRIVIYSAFYGSSKEGAAECPEDEFLKYEECSKSFATETAVNTCQGRQKCALSADSASFGLTNCSVKARVFLNVVYTCVFKDSLQDLEFEEESDLDYPSIFKEPNASEILHNLKSADNVRVTTPTPYIKDFIDDFNVVTTTKKVDVQSDETSDETTEVNCTVADDNQKVIGFISEWIAAYKFITENKEKFILYVTLSLGVGVLLFLLVLTARLYTQQRRQMRENKLNISEPLPFDGGEGDLLDPYDPRHDRGVEVVRYTNTSTIRRQDSTSQPRAPLAHSMNNYYYS